MDVTRCNLLTRKQTFGGPRPILESLSRPSQTRKKTPNCKPRLTPRKPNKRMPDVTPASIHHSPATALHNFWLTRNSISGPMTLALVGYSTTFMRYAFAVTPKNYLLFACHAVNFSAQSIQSYRYLNYWKYVHYIRA